MTMFDKLKAHLKKLTQIAYNHANCVEAVYKTEINIDAFLCMNRHGRICRRVMDGRIFRSSSEWMFFRINDVYNLAITNLYKLKVRASLTFLSRVLKAKLPQDLAWTIIQYKTPKTYKNIGYRTIYNVKKTPRIQ